MMKCDPRYHPTRWAKQSRFTRALTRNRCVKCLGRATETHHLSYGISCNLIVAMDLFVATLIEPVAGVILGLVVAVLGYKFPRLEGMVIPVPGYEVPGYQLAPLCDDCHSNSKGCAHNFSNYQVSKRSNWLNRNTIGYRLQLRLWFVRTMLLVWSPLWVPVVVGCWCR